MTLDRVTEPTDRRSAGTLANLRDVGTASPLLRRGVLYRSDAPLSTDEPPLAHPWPPTTVIDLRDHGEKAEPHPYRHTSRVVDLPLLAGSVRAPQTLANGLAALYTHLLHTPTTASLLVAAVQTIAEADGGVLVHCTAGKDRTGVTVAIALRLVGIDHDAIIADYTRTAAMMPAVQARMARTVRRSSREPARVSLPPEVLAAPSHAIEALLQALEEHDGGVHGWYLTHGGEPRLLDALAQRLLH
ncbi:MAG TPA: tyrosine-protein phosphatase [Natronosporangium sp.]|jgi:protein-tyrosine phosphatase|nr:tyrosine-protein phosphatase [Natronosporangium sp.]